MLLVLAVLQVPVLQLLALQELVALQHSIMDQQHILLTVVAEQLMLEHQHLVVLEVQHNPYQV
jgi:hypothetical protein